MTEDEYKWHVNLVKERHHQFKLTFQQAEKVYVFEKEKELYSPEYVFSAWEEFDYLLDNYRKILTEKQFKAYLKSHNEDIKRLEGHLIETDKTQEKYIDYYYALIEFYEQNYLPDFYKDKFLMTSLILSRQKEKIEYLKSEYKKYLDSQRVGLISAHYRHNRLFKPNELTVTLLRHKLSYIIPSYSSFKAKMDAPTEGVAKYLLIEFNYLLEKYAELIKSKEEERIAFIKETKQKYLGNSTGGYTTVLHTNEQAKNENKIMQIILLDKDWYYSTIKQTIFTNPKH